MPTSENRCAGDRSAPRTCPPPGCGARTRRVSPRPPTAAAADRSFSPRGDAPVPVPGAGKGEGGRKSSGREAQSGTPSFSLSAAARFLVRSPAPARLPLALPAPARSKCARRCGAARGAGGRGRRLPHSPAVGAATSPPETRVRGPAFRRPLPGSRSVRLARETAVAGKQPESGRRPGFRSGGSAAPDVDMPPAPETVAGPTGAGRVAGLSGRRRGGGWARAAWAS